MIRMLMFIAVIVGDAGLAERLLIRSFFFAGECMPDNRMCVQPDTPGRCGQRNGCGVVIDAVL